MFSRRLQHRGSSGRCGARCNGRATRSDRACSARRAGRRPARSRRRRTEGTSRSTSSGAARTSPRRRARAWSPSTPSSARAVARTLASTTITVLPQRSRRYVERHRPAGPTTGPVQNVLHCRAGCLRDQPRAQVLLKRLVRRRSTPTKHRMLREGVRGPSSLPSQQTHPDDGSGESTHPGSDRMHCRMMLVQRPPPVPAGRVTPSTPQGIARPT